MRRRLLFVPLFLLACSEREAPAAPEPAARAGSEGAAKVAGPPEPVRADLLVPPPRLPRGLVENTPGATPGYVLFNPTLSDTAYLVQA